MKENSALFNAIDFKKKVETIIKECFENDESKPPKFWYKAFDNHKIKCYNSFVLKVSQFPAFVVYVTATPSLTHIHSTQINQYSKVLLEIHLYNKSSSFADKETLGMEISYRIQQAIQENYTIPLTTDMSIYNPDESVNKQILRYSFTYDNINKIIYKGE